MTRRQPRARDADLDERPFGDSHFGEAQRHRKGLEKPHAGSRGRRTPDRSSAPPPYAWHDGFFDDLGPQGPRSGRART
jgi:hypothetical protein